MKSISDILKILAEWVRKTIWFLGLHAFSLILIFVLLDFILGGFIFYEYVFLAEKQEPKTAENILKFDEKTYQEVLGQLHAREQSNQELPAASQPNASGQPQK